ncbi:MAG: MBL fold metallo-hydrolase, partial [Caldilineaceae bacterium]
MSSKLAKAIRDTQVEPASVAIFYLAQSGFVYKSPAGVTVCIDAYLSDCVHRLLAAERFGFKRMIPSPLAPDELDVDMVVCTHAHADHFDYDAIPVFAANPRIRFVAAPDCEVEFEKLGIPSARVTIVREGDTVEQGDVRMTAVFADHGDLAPEALGIVLTIGDIVIWQVADSAYRPDRWGHLFGHVDVIIPPINGAYGNLDALEAARLASDAQAKLAIPCHFWMFAEHGGNPAQFLEACQELAPRTRATLMAPGESLVYRK